MVVAQIAVMPGATVRVTWAGPGRRQGTAWTPRVGEGQRPGRLQQLPS